MPTYAPQTTVVQILPSALGEHAWPLYVLSILYLLSALLSIATFLNAFFRHQTFTWLDWKHVIRVFALIFMGYRFIVTFFNFKWVYYWLVLFGTILPIVLQFTGLSLLVVYIIWKAFKMYNRKAWVVVLVHAIYLGVIWIAAFVTTAFIARQTRVALMAVWTSVAAYVMVGLFGSTQGLASYWAYTRMKSALNVGSRSIAFKFMLAIAVLLFMDVVRGVWNIANLFGVNVLDDLFTLLVVAGDRSAYAIYLSFFGLVEALPIAAMLWILSSEDVDSTSNQDGYSPLVAQTNGTNGPHTYGTTSTQGTAREGRQDQVWKSYPDTYEEDGFGSPYDDFDQTLDEDDFVTESESPYKTVDFHPGHVRSSAAQTASGMEKRHSADGYPHRGQNQGSGGYGGSRHSGNSGEKPPSGPGNRSRPGSRGRRQSQLGQDANHSQLTESQAGIDLKRIQQLHAPHFGTIETTPSFGPVAPAANRSRPETSSTDAYISTNDATSSHEGTFSDFHSLAKPHSPSPPPNLLTISTLSSSPGMTLPTPTQSLPRATSPSITDLSPTSSLSTPTDSSNQVPLSRFRTSS